ncbi:MAG: helix-turn-helix transcriptional regulator [Pseudomonadota bacterium]
MANIALVLKEEITRLARKELRGQTAQLKKVSAQYRTEIAALKRRISALEKQVPRALKSRETQVKAEPTTDVANGKRFSAKGLRTLRARLDLSAKDFAKLLGVSDQSVNKWEAERAVPRAAQLASIAAIRKIGKREALAKLALVS